MKYFLYFSLTFNTNIVLKILVENIHFLYLLVGLTSITTLHFFNCNKHQ